MRLQKQQFCAVIALVCLFATSAMAVNPFAGGPFPVGWWDSSSETMNPALTAGMGGNTMTAYGASQTYLDNALAAGVRVIINIPYDDPVFPLASTFHNHPAVAGFNIAEEVWYARGIQLWQIQPRYDAIKALTDKPVFITFTEYGLNPAESGGATSIAEQWQTAYDQLMVDVYPTRIGGPEFSRLNNEGRGKDFKNDMIRAQQVSIATGKPWWTILSGWGTSNSSPPTGDYRLPTAAESRFATYWSLSHEAAGIQHFAAYRTFGANPSLVVAAQPGEPYPYDGQQWLTDVYEPEVAELNLMSDALQFGKIANFVTDNTANVRSDLYVDTNTGFFFLIALNETFGNTNTTFNLNMPTHLWNVTRLFEGGATPMNFVNGQFVDTFTDFEVHVYVLTAAPPPIPGDVNLDGQVDGLDLTYVGAYWQISGTEWTTGDLNGDGVTNGLDLNIVGENWQVGVPAPGQNIPEPTTLALLGLGTMAILRRRHKTSRPA